MQRLLSLAAVERLGIHRLHEVVNQEQEQAPKEDQAHHSQEDEAANEEGVHNLQGRETQRSWHVTAPVCPRSLEGAHHALEKRTSGAPPGFSPCFSSLARAFSVGCTVCDKRAQESLQKATGNVNVEQRCTEHREDRS